MWHVSEYITTNVVDPGDSGAAAGSGSGESDGDTGYSYNIFTQPSSTGVVGSSFNIIDGLFVIPEVINEGQTTFEANSSEVYYSYYNSGTTKAASAITTANIYETGKGSYTTELTYKANAGYFYSYYAFSIIRGEEDITYNEEWSSANLTTGSSSSKKTIIHPFSDNLVFTTYEITTGYNDKSGKPFSKDVISAVISNQKPQQIDYYGDPYIMYDWYYDADGNPIEYTYYQQDYLGTTTINVPVTTTVLTINNNEPTYITSNTESLVTYPTTIATTGTFINDTGTIEFPGTCQYGGAGLVHTPIGDMLVKFDLKNFIITKETWYADTDRGEYFIVNTNEDDSPIYNCETCSSTIFIQTLKNNLGQISSVGAADIKLENPIDLPLIATDYSFFFTPQTSDTRSTVTAIGDFDSGIQNTGSYFTVGYGNRIPWVTENRYIHYNSVTGDASDVVSTYYYIPYYYMTQTNSYSTHSTYTVLYGGTGTQIIHNGGTHTAMPSVGFSPVRDGSIGDLANLGSPFEFGKVSVPVQLYSPVAGVPNSDFSSLIAGNLGFEYLTANAQFPINIPDVSIRPGMVIPQFFHTTSYLFSTSTDRDNWTYLNVSRVDYGPYFFSTWTIGGVTTSGSMEIMTVNEVKEMNIVAGEIGGIDGDVVFGGNMYPQGGSYRIFQGNGATSICIYNESGSSSSSESRNEYMRSFSDVEMTPDLSVLHVYPLIPPTFALVTGNAPDPGL